MALSFFWRAEGLTLDATHDFTAGDNTGTVNSGALINTDAAFIGTNGLDLPTTADFVFFTVSSGDLIDASEGAIGLWFRIVTFGAGRSLFVANNTGAPNNHIRLYMTGTDELELKIRLVAGADVTLTTTAADLATATWYFVIARWNAVTEDRRIEVYNDDMSLRHAVEDLTTAFDAPTGIDVLSWGDNLGIAGDHHQDNMFIADTYAEPLEDFSEITSFTQYGAAGGPVPPFTSTTVTG